MHRSILSVSAKHVHHCGSTSCQEQWPALARSIYSLSETCILTSDLSIDTRRPLKNAAAPWLWCSFNAGDQPCHDQSHPFWVHQMKKKK